jgi:hypothetical protein
MKSNGKNIVKGSLDIASIIDDSMGNHFHGFMKILILAVMLFLTARVVTAGSDSIYLERESAGKGEYIRVIKDLDAETVDQVLRMLEVKRNYQPRANFGYRLEKGTYYFKKTPLFADAKYRAYKYRLPVEAKDSTGYGVRKCEIEVPLEDYLALDGVRPYGSHNEEGGREYIRVVSEEGEEIPGRFNRERLTISFPVILGKDAAKLYYLYFGKEGSNETGSSEEKLEPGPVLPHVPQDEDIIDISKDDKFGFEWWVKLIKEAPFGISFWNMKSVTAEGGIPPTEGSYSNRVDLKLSKKMRDVDTFDWLVFKDGLDIPVFEDSFLEYDIRAETTIPELGVGIFCRLDTPLSNIFSRRLFDHVTFEKGERDEMGVEGKLSTELNLHIEKKWYHRRLPLKEYAGKKIDHLFFKVQGTLQDLQNTPDILTYYFDNVQITRGDKPEVRFEALEVNRAWISR